MQYILNLLVHVFSVETYGKTGCFPGWLWLDSGNIARAVIARLGSTGLKLNLNHRLPIKTRK